MLAVHSEAIGYGRLGMQLMRGLQAQGVTIYDGISAPDDGNFANNVMEREGNRRYGRTESITWVSVPTHARGWYEGQRASIFTMWETTHLPESFRENLDDFDVVVVPSEQNVELFGRYHSNVKLCLLGVDTDAWHFQARRPPTTR